MFFHMWTSYQASWPRTQSLATSSLSNITENDFSLKTADLYDDVHRP